mmetsp:Transcript_30624/g.64979  ORF Transcript_30624/g.64979 Transcript_30624/m.64979 type:complete len:257 (-) Transcript_30624:344-1114(-)
MQIRNTFLCFEEETQRRRRCHSCPHRVWGEEAPPAAPRDLKAPAAEDAASTTASGRSSPALSFAPSEEDEPAAQDLAPALVALLQRPEAGNTTVMVKNIPFSCTQRLVLRHWSRQGLTGAVDLFYLPMDLKRKVNMGYAFANFTSEAHAQQFCATVDGLRLEEFRKAKPLKTCVARVQGFNANFRNFRKSSNIGTRQVPEYRPIVLDPSTRAEIPFPTLEKDRRRPSPVAPVADPAPIALPPQYVPVMIYFPQWSV